MAMPTTTLAGTAIFARPKNLHAATDTAPETAATTLPRDSRCEKSRQIKSEVQTKAAMAVGTSTTAPTMAPIVHETPHVAMRITLSTKDSRGPQSSPSISLASEMPYASSVSVAATASVWRFEAPLRCGAIDAE